MKIYLDLFPKDENGIVVKRTKQLFPYNYDGFILYRKHPNEYSNTTLYSDRLRQNSKDWDSLLKKYFNNISDYFDDRCPEKIELFLQELLNKPNLELVFIMEYCNQSTGFPVYRFEVKI